MLSLQQSEILLLSRPSQILLNMPHMAARALAPNLLTLVNTEQQQGTDQYICARLGAAGGSTCSQEFAPRLVRLRNHPFETS